MSCNNTTLAGRFHRGRASSGYRARTGHRVKGDRHDGVSRRRRARPRTSRRTSRVTGSAGRRRAASKATSPTSRATTDEDDADFEGHKLGGRRRSDEADVSDDDEDARLRGSPAEQPEKVRSSRRVAPAPRVGLRRGAAGRLVCVLALCATCESWASTASSASSRRSAATSSSVRSSSAASRATTAAPPRRCSATARARRAVCSRSSPIAAWFANMISRSISPERERSLLGAVEHLQHAERSCRRSRAAPPSGPVGT